jgi:AcrR family transcriptional regulator
MSGYQRARRPEQKAQRRATILAAARALAAQRPVREISLGDIAREVDLAKSNLLRYFESREEIFMTLLLDEWTAWTEAARATPDAVGLAR